MVVPPESVLVSKNSLVLISSCISRRCDAHLNRQINMLFQETLLFANVEQSSIQAHTYEYDVLKHSFLMIRHR
jgi:hypothetical protein